MRRTQAGFTALELAIVVGIFAVGAAIAIPRFMKYMNTPTSTEPEVQLGKLSKILRTARESAGTFPVGIAGTLPAAGCCGLPNNRCPALTKATWAADPVWNALGFAIEEPLLFQYSYTSDGTTVTVTATGDLDCDGQKVTYSLVGAADGSLQLMRPTARD